MFFYIEFILKTLANLQVENPIFLEEELIINNNYIRALSRLLTLTEELSSVNQDNCLEAKDVLLDIHFEFSNLLWEFYRVNELLIKATSNQRSIMEIDIVYEIPEQHENSLIDDLKKLIRQLQKIDKKNIITKKKLSDTEMALDILLGLQRKLKIVCEEMCNSSNRKIFFHQLQNIFNDILDRLYIFDEIIWELFRSYNCDEGV